MGKNAGIDIGVVGRTPAGVNPLYDRIASDLHKQKEAQVGLNRRISVLRIGHRLVRDDRVTTHSALVSRAFGAEVIYMTGVDISVRQTLESVSKRWGGEFRVELIDNWRGLVKQWKAEGGKVVHLTMYGIDLRKGISKLNGRSSINKKVLVIIGAEKVPREAYDLADYNISVGNQPHSEIAALAIFMDRLLSGAELDKKFDGAALRIVPSPRGKRVRELARKSIN